MIQIKRATADHIDGINKVCSDGYRDTYHETHSKEYIERIITEFYNHDRILDEVTHTNEGWDGWFVALEEDHVVGAIGGGSVGESESEVFVLYLDPGRRGEGIGTKLLEALTEVQRQKGASKQWVSVAKGNMKGIPFYEARKFALVKEQKSFANMDNEEYTSLRYCRAI
ncbi:GNAT family N-acetyltransferase [Bacillus sp. FJAT-27251]|uniref:GNAT family N-acetyltransferase n=1 Tax=Bacillus sp. FJAT-27251 TaxID=1684142 RepID=UPI0006A7AB7A|nr:GNAT family N-acetyltransferase [Bacillus sp. FJAT-27251]